MRFDLMFTTKEKYINFQTGLTCISFWSLKECQWEREQTWLEFTYEAMVTAEQRLESEHEKYFKEKDSENPRQGCE